MANEIEIFMRQALESNANERGEDAGYVAKAPIGVPQISPFVDWDYYYLRDEISWIPNKEYDKKFKRVDVPKGFVTDLASIPRALWAIMPPTAKYTHAAIVHDYLYWTQPETIPRSDVDTIFSLGMSELEVKGWKASAIYKSVSLFGGTAWKNNGKLKEGGEKRILRKFPKKPTISWQEWKARPDVFVS